MKFSLIFLFFLIAIAYACTPLTGGEDQKGGQDGRTQDDKDAVKAKDQEEGNGDGALDRNDANQDGEDDGETAVVAKP
uniref:Secreted protein n=1 Tax=Steinernema glaseri TaxID=37863 RepID=A0A1I7Z4F8_9BILA